MPVTNDQIAAARRVPVTIGRMYQGIDYNLGFDEIVDAATGDEVAISYATTGPLPSAGAVPTYVSQYFAEHPGKPTISFGRIGDNPYGSLRPKVAVKTLTLDEAATYLWWFMGQLKGTPDADWSSYGVPICLANVEMTAQDIFRTGDPMDYQAIEASEVPGTNKERLWLATVCAAPFRLHGGLRVDYKRDVSIKILAYLNTLVKNPDFDLLEFVGDKGQWEQDKRYSKVIAGIDMFLVRFNQEDYSRLRLCTIGSRYKDCAALVGVEYLRNLLTVPFGEIFLWVWTKGIANDMRRVFKKGEELTVMHSFLPYVSSMKLAERSPYSATVNPSLHYFIHFSGALMGHQRSLNARLVGDGNMMDPLFNAQILAYAKCGRANWDSQFRQKGSTAHVVKVDVAPVPGEDPTVGEARLETPQPPGTHPTEWWRYIQTHGSTIPRIIEVTNVSHCLQIPAPRANTVGFYLLNWAKGRTQAQNRLCN